MNIIVRPRSHSFPGRNRQRYLLLHLSSELKSIFSQILRALGTISVRHDSIRRGTSRGALPAGPPFSDLDSAVGPRHPCRHRTASCDPRLGPGSDVRSAGYPPIVGFCRSNGFGPAWISGLGTVEPLFQHALPLHADAQRVLNSNGTSAALFKRSLHAGH